MMPTSEQVISNAFSVGDNSGLATFSPLRRSIYNNRRGRGQSTARKRVEYSTSSVEYWFEAMRPTTHRQAGGMAALASVWAPVDGAVSGPTCIIIGGGELATRVGGDRGAGAVRHSPVA